VNGQACAANAEVVGALWRCVLLLWWVRGAACNMENPQTNTHERSGSSGAVRLLLCIGEPSAGLCAVCGTVFGV